MTRTRRIRQQWSSRGMFVLAATGSAVGLGNIWKFPYIAGENGGGAFVLVYLACVALIGIPIMMAEIMIGRMGRQNPVATMKKLAQQSGASSLWSGLGVMGVVAGFVILSYYSVIAGWAVAYIVKVASGEILSINMDQMADRFSRFIADPWQLLFWHSLFMAATVAIVVGGVQSGLEKAVEFLTPALLILLMVLVGYAYSAGDFRQGLAFLFALDYNRLTGASILVAMGHAFFTLSLAMGAIMTYGSYLPDGLSIARATWLIAVSDTVVALLAGLAIFPLVFANQLQPDMGPSLIFQTLPLAFAQMPMGTLFGALFFVLLTFAALSSSISLIEPAVAWLVEGYGISRLRAGILSGLACWLLGFGTVFSFNLWRQWTLFGKTFFDLLDFVTSNLLLPLGGLLLAIFAGWHVEQQRARTALATSYASFIGWRILIRYIAPTSVGLVLMNSLGVL